MICRYDRLMYLVTLRPKPLGQKLVIDPIAPELSPSNLPDGVAWDNPGTALLATLRDVDPGSKLVNHQLKNVTPITPSTPITLNPANLAIDGTLTSS